MTMQVGEGFAGTAPNLAHVNTVLGDRHGSVGTAFTTALAQPSPGHVPFLAVVRPGVAVQPPTLFVNKAAVASELHGTLTWGAAQAGVAEGVVDALADGIVDAAQVGELVLVCAVWVDPAADDEDAVRQNNRTATRAALAAGRTGSPHVDEVVALRGQAKNPYLSAVPVEDSEQHQKD
jgi:5,6,7,8-tetrahydromethanopterin hydro-lyase